MEFSISSHSSQIAIYDLNDVFKVQKTLGFKKNIVNLKSFCGSWDSKYLIYKHNGELVEIELSTS